MPPVIEQHRTEIAELCRKYHIKQLELFGSAARGNFDADRSDVDFLVLFEETKQGGGDALICLNREFELLLGKKVDLVDIRSARNPYFIADALKTRVRLYAA